MRDQSLDTPKLNTHAPIQAVVEQYQLWRLRLPSAWANENVAGVRVTVAKTAVENEGAKRLAQQVGDG